MTKLKNKSNLFKDNVFGNALGGLLTAAILWFMSTFFGWWSFIIDASRSLLLFFTSPILIPIWFLFLLVLFSIILFIGILSSFFLNKSNTFSSYITDVLYEIKWRWSYSNSDIIRVSCHCPDCDLQLYPDNLGIYSGVDYIRFTCEDCKKVLKDFEGSYENLEDRVIRSIQKNLRSGLWKKIVQNK